MRGEAEGHPRQWLAEHTTAHLELQIVPHGQRRWALIGGPLTSGRVIKAWPCDRGAVCAER